MPVTSASEFEAVCNRVLIKIDKKMYVVGEKPSLQEARRELDAFHDLARDSKALKDARPRVEKISDSLQVEMPDDDEVRNFMWDLVDYIDYQI